MSTISDKTDFSSTSSNDLLESLNYQILANIKSNGFTKIKFAKQEDKHFFIKIISKNTIFTCKRADSSYLKMEIVALRKLSHPHVVKLVDSFESMSKIYIVTKAVQGITLFKALQAKGAMSETRSREISRQLASALAYCHSRHIAHGDVSLDNVVLTRGCHATSASRDKKASRNDVTVDYATESDDRRCHATSASRDKMASGDDVTVDDCSAEGDDKRCHVTLVDFGSATVVTDDKQRSDCFAGTPVFASPQIIMRMPYLPMKADVWSLGVLVFCVRLGRTPFEEPLSARLHLHALRSGVSFGDIEKAVISNSFRSFIQSSLVFDEAIRPDMQHLQKHAWLSNN